MKTLYDYLPVEVQRRRRGEQSKALRKYDNSQPLEPCAEAVVITDKDYAQNRYVQLAARVMSTQIQLLTPAIREHAWDSAFGSGYRAIGRIVEYAPPAYREYAQRTDQRPDVNVLLDTLLRSREQALEVLAKMHGPDNIVFETFLGLKNDLPILDRNPYVMTAATGDVPVYRPDPEMWMKAEDEIDGLHQINDEPKAPAFRICPAIGPLMTAGWEGVVNAAANDPEYFAADLALEQVLTAPSGVE